MTIGGWIAMILSVGSVSVFFAWTLSLALSRSHRDHHEEHLHSTLDEPPDLDQ